ncbi:MAG TPA: PhoPQ-activated protein PqaA family protein, partial [Arenibacter sp.]|nr:PhoPQ-activated protein PqaA family protein [Arenibacter sp.]
MKNPRYLFLLLSLALLTACKDKTAKPIDSPAIASAVTPETALISYINNDDSHYKWELKDTYTIGESTAYDLLLTSQKWREFVWTHQLTLLVPKEVAHDGALLMITGGRMKDGAPNWTSKENDKNGKNYALLAEKNK